MGKFQEGWLLPCPHNLRQKPNSLKQRPCGLLPPTGSLRWTGSTNSRLDQNMSHSCCGPISLSFFKLTNPKLEKENFSEPLKSPALQKRPDVQLPQFLFCPHHPSPRLCRGFFPLCARCMCVSSPLRKSLCNCRFCPLTSVCCLTCLHCYLASSSISLPFNSLMAEKMNPIQTLTR